MTRVIILNGKLKNISNMSNPATTNYKVTGSRKAVSNLWATLQGMNVNSKNVWLYQLAEHYGIDYEAKQISVRGHIYWAEYEEDPAKDSYLLSFDTETSWDACNELFEEINHALGDDLSISYRVCECGCDVFYVHDEGSFFPEECCVSSSGEPFDDVCEDVYNTIEDAILEWTSKTGIEQGERTNEEMVDFINGYEYENDDTYYYIHPFTFE
ncbi:hypothetical protein L6469_03960 [Segatella baroniae B14]|jgi:hypothetical protein|uniref:Uncharacterized protein n=2 Tax=Prevotellaceae TaxID=171552 RepID=A0AA37I501_SEGBR|nr:hypothetical protein [Segatella baroniae]UKK78844.1 hypothetical protein L6469_03960 [Segatella baroniae B14]GJG29115.1 hypothetical protein PRRU23_28150 [Segatella bryantii]